MTVLDAPPPIQAQKLSGTSVPSGRGRRTKQIKASNTPIPEKSECEDLKSSEKPVTISPPVLLRKKAKNKPKTVQKTSEVISSTTAEKNTDVEDSKISGSSTKVSSRQRSKTSSVKHKTKSAAKDSVGACSDIPDGQKLSSSGMAMIDDIRNHSVSRDVEPRTGKISMSELMGYGRDCPSPSDNSIGRSIMHRLTRNTVDPESILRSALRQMPRVPGFPSFKQKTAWSPLSSGFRPELFKTTMEAYASAALQCGVNFRESRSSNSRASPDQLMPWINFAPMFPLEANPLSDRRNKPRSPMHYDALTGGDHSQTRSPFIRNPDGMSPKSVPISSWKHPNSVKNLGSPLSPVYFNNAGSTTTQKTRKPFFMPYLSGDAVSRGLVSGELIKGSLRVNQRNYEESHVDNPEGDDQLDLLILGVHDRNRALHGDVVVVRVKERINWVVRENLYLAWRQGHLNISKDDNGQPLTIPPLAVSKLMDQGPYHGEVPVIPVSAERKYAREDILSIGIQLGTALLQSVAIGDGHISANIQPSSHLRSMIDSLSIGRENNEPAFEPIKPVTPLKKHITTVGKRPNFRMLADMPDEDWGVPDVCLQKTAEVVYISEAKNCRAAMGQLKVMTDGNRNWALFSPTDSRMPRMMIPSEQLPIGFFDRPHDFSKFIFIARLVEWQATAQFARGRLEKTLGLAGDLEAETEGLLFSSNIDTREFSHSVMSCLPVTESTPWKIHDNELKYRQDLRDEIVFSISPHSSKDISQAFHIKRLPAREGLKNIFEVGVHIADVAHFVRENTELDSWAASRGNSVDLVHKVVPMLPRVLCEDLCSFHAGLDRLAFSVIFDVNDRGDILKESFGRTIIQCKANISHTVVQNLVDCPTKVLGPGEISSSSIEHVCSISEKVLDLHAICRILHNRRVDDGALVIKRPKISLSLNVETHSPKERAIVDSEELVEELVVLVNKAVAKKIESTYPSAAILRRQAPLKEKTLREVVELCETVGFSIDSRSAQSLSNSLRKFEGDLKIKDYIWQVVSTMMMKPMQSPQYFCAGAQKTTHYHHYALNVPIYTHFTSPLNRYADIMVHRFLAASLGYCPPPEKSIQELEKQAQHCNDKRFASDAVREACDETLLGTFLQSHGPVEAKGVVINVLENSFDVLVLSYGVVKRVYVNRLEMAREPNFREGPPAELLLHWSTDSNKGNASIDQTLRICTVVDVVLSSLPEPTKYQVAIRKHTGSETLTLLDMLKR